MEVRRARKGESKPERNKKSRGRREVRKDGKPGKGGGKSRRDIITEGGGGGRKAGSE